MKNNKIHNKWAIRVSSASEVGAGHFMRCLSIANELVIRSNRVHFFIDSNAAKWKKYSTDLDISFSLASESKFVSREFFGCIIDGYEFNQNDYQHWKMCCRHLVVIDDYGNAPDYSSVIISPSLKSHPLSNTPIKIMLGPSYALLSQEYSIKSSAKYDSSTVKMVLISCGMRDSNNYNSFALKLLKQLEYNGMVIVALGSDAPHMKTLKYELSEYGFHIKIITNTNGLYEILKKVNLVIGSGGLSLLERMSLGIPSLTFITAENQSAQVQMAESIEGTVCINPDKVIWKRDLLDILDNLLNNMEYRDRMSKNSKNYIDGKGVQRVVNELDYLPKE